MSHTVESQTDRTRSVGLNTPTTASPAKALRIPALDFTKGALVLFMVFYHWANYFVGPQWPYYTYLRFLTPSFIFITGFMISNVYLSKYDIADRRLPKRLTTRGLKLSAIFIVLNVVRGCLQFVLHRDGAVSDAVSVRNIETVFITGDFTSKIVAFYILLPIAYLLLLSGILMFSQRMFKYTFHVSCLFVFLILAALEFYGMKYQNLEIIAIGLLGTLVGFARREVINRIVWHPYLLALAYFVYVIAISIWNVPYPLEVIGTCLSVTIIYLIGTIDWKWHTIQDEIVLLGKYSLFGYISQIAILQVLELSLRHVGFRGAALLTSFVAAIVLTILGVEIVDHVRRSSAGADRLYKAVFN